MIENYDIKTIISCGFYIICVIIGVIYLYKKRRYMKEGTLNKSHGEIYNNNK